MQALGIQIDKPFVRAALLQKRRSGIKICSLKSALFTEPEPVKQLYIPHFKGFLTSGLSSKDLLIRPIELKLADNRHIEEALTLQSEGTTHLNLSDILTVPHAIKKEKGKVAALLCTASRSGLKTHLQELDKIQADPDCVSSNCLALISYIRWQAPSFTSAFLIDLGSSEWTCIWMENGELKKSHCLPFGVEGLLAALWEDRKKILLPKEVEGVAKQIDLLQIKPHLNPCLSEKLDEMRQELGKTILSFYRIANQRQIIFTGHIDAFGHLREFLIESFKETIYLKPHVEIEHHKFAIPIGLALEQMKNPLQLLQQEFFPKKKWRKAGLYALILTCSSLLISCIFLTTGLKALEMRKREIFDSIQPTLARWDLLSNDDTAISQWIRAIEMHSKESPYILQAPRVAEVLSWITNHPLLIECKNEGDPLEVRAVHYQLTEFPQIGSLQERYQAKLELEFGVKSPMTARKFHEVLLTDHHIIDTTREVHWEAQHDGYRASFYLKNHRAPYVP